MRIYTTEEVSKMFNCARITVIHWCNNNNVNYIGEGKRKTYQITKDDIERFKKREKPGRRWHKK